jgi:hypothetical protein
MPFPAASQVVGGKAEKWTAEVGSPTGIPADFDYFGARLVIPSAAQPPDPAGADVNLVTPSPLVLASVPDATPPAGRGNIPWDSDNGVVVFTTFGDFSGPYNAYFTFELAYAKYDSALNAWTGTTHVVRQLTIVPDAVNPFHIMSGGNAMISGNGQWVTSVIYSNPGEVSEDNNFYVFTGTLVELRLSTGPATFFVAAGGERVNRDLPPNSAPVVATSYKGDAVLISTPAYACFPAVIDPETGDAMICGVATLWFVSGGEQTQVVTGDDAAAARAELTDDNTTVVTFTGGTINWYKRSGGGWIHAATQSVAAAGFLSGYEFVLNHSTASVFFYDPYDVNTKAKVYSLTGPDPDTGLYSVKLEESPTGAPFGSGGFSYDIAEYKI